MTVIAMIHKERIEESIRIVILVVWMIMIGNFGIGIHDIIIVYNIQFEN